jgi:hypothetical protein
MAQKQLQALPSTMFNSFLLTNQVDIMFIKDEIHTLIDIVIANATRANLFL